MASALSATIFTRAAFKARRTQATARKPVQVQAFQITFRRDTGDVKVAECKEGEYLLDVADANRIDIPASCRGGVCGSCVAKLVSGKVDMGWACELDDGNVLTEEQMAAGYILPCSAIPLTDIELEYSYEWGVKILEQWNSRERVGAV
eukprot:scaffold17.g491.t1